MDLDRPDRLNQPIIILSIPRSGSSMTAGIFARHGVWTGECSGPKSYNRKGVFENMAIRAELIRRWGQLTHNRSLASCEPQCGFRDTVEAILRHEGYTAGPWLFKQSALYRDAWHEFNPLFVGVRRHNVVEALLSRQKTVGGGGREGAERIVARHNAVLDRCEVIVKTDEVVAGNYSSLEDAFAYCGLEFDSTIVDEFVDPTLWHH